MFLPLTRRSCSVVAGEEAVLELVLEVALERWDEECALMEISWLACVGDLLAVCVFGTGFLGCENLQRGSVIGAARLSMEMECSTEGSGDGMVVTAALMINKGPYNLRRT